MKPKYIAQMARWAVPLAMVVILAYEINASVQVVGYWQIALLIGSIASAIGLEATGMLSGDIFDRSWRLGDYKRVVLSATLAIVYTVIATYILWHNKLMRVIPTVAIVTYLLSALSDGLDSLEIKAASVDGHEIEEAAKDRELERSLQIANTKLKHEERMARIAAKGSQNAPQKPRKASQVAAKHYECVCGRVFVGSRSYNAHRRSCEIPAERPARIYENGAAK